MKYYIFNIIDTILRMAIVFLLFYIGFRFRSMDTDVIKSRIFLKYDKLNSALNIILLVSPLFLLSAFLEYPGLKTYYDEDTIHLIQDICLVIFQPGVIYFLYVLSKSLNRPEQ
jgi:hypothetical protein